MKIKLYELTLFITALFIFGCTSSDEEAEMHSVKQNEITEMEYSKMIDRINDIYNSDNRALNKSGNNGKGVKHVAFYSDDGIWSADFPIFDKDGNLTHIVHINLPQNGEDRALVFNETDMMVNFTSHDPRMYIYEFGKGVIYDNWCEADRSGLFKGRGKTEYVAVDRDGDGVTDFYWWGPYAPVDGDKNYIFHIKATLTAEPCNVNGDPVAFSYTYQGQNGNVRITSSIQ